MHVPRAVAFLRRFRWFRFLDAHHKVHHKYMLSNLNVILPLADLTLGTLRDAEGRKVRPVPASENSRLCGKIAAEGQSSMQEAFLAAEMGAGAAGTDDGGSGAARLGAGRPHQCQEPVPSGRPGGAAGEGGHAGDRRGLPGSGRRHRRHADVQRAGDHRAVRRREAGADGRADGPAQRPGIAARGRRNGTSCRHWWRRPRWWRAATPAASPTAAAASSAAPSARRRARRQNDGQ